MFFEYLIFGLIGLTQTYCCNIAKERYSYTEDAKIIDGIVRRHRRLAESQFILHSHDDDFTDANVLILGDQTLQGSPTGRIISSQQHTQQSQQLYGHPNNHYYQQQPQTFQIIHSNSAQKPRGNQQTHNSRQLKMNRHYNSNKNVYHNNNGFNGNNMKNKNKMLQEQSGQVSNIYKHNRNNGNHNTYQVIEYNNGATRNSAILDTSVEMNAKSANAASFTKPAARVDEAAHTPTIKSVTPAYITRPPIQSLGPQNINSNNYLLTEIIAYPIKTTIKPPSSIVFTRSQFRRNVPDNPFLNKHMPQNEFMQNPFLSNRQTNAYTQQNSQSHLNNQSSQNDMFVKPTVQNRYMLNPFLQNTKIPNLSAKSQPTQVPATDLVQTQIETSSNNSSNLVNAQKPENITSAPATSTAYPISKATTISVELSQLIRNRAVIFPDSVYLTQSNPSSEHILDIRR